MVKIDLAQWVAVFGGMVILDFIWVGYVKALQVSTALRAGAWAGFMIVTSGFVQISYVSDHWLLIPAGLGAFVGTWSAVEARKLWSR